MKRRLLYLAARLTAFLPRRAQIALSGEPAVIVDGQQLDPQVQLLRARRAPSSIRVRRRCTRCASSR
jgi:hypothetical protein